MQGNCGLTRSLVEEQNDVKAVGGTSCPCAQTPAKSLVIVGKTIKRAAALTCLLAAFPATARAVSTSEFLIHCEATPEPCKAKVLAYVKFLVDGGFLDQCIMQLPAGDVAAKLIGWMRDHPEYREKDWVDCLDDALAALKLCKP
jgi:hypothetical protein